MKYIIEIDLPDNETVREEIKSEPIKWSVWGYSGYAFAKPPTVGGWISVKKRLPELKRYDEDGDTWLMSAPVLVATTKGVTIGYYEDDLDPKFKPGWNDREHGERIKVTHWMELPERPKK